MSYEIKIAREQTDYFRGLVIKGYFQCTTLALKKSIGGIGMENKPVIRMIDVLCSEGCYREIRVGSEGVVRIVDTTVDDGEGIFYKEYTAFSKDDKPIFKVGGNVSVIVHYE